MGTRERLEHGVLYPDRYRVGEECWADLDGHKMRYLRVVPTSGGNEKPPLVLMHGFFAYSFSWRKNIEVLARDRTVYAIDHLGCGFSERPERGTVDFSLPGTARRLLGWIRSQGLKSVDVVGSSLGGALTLFMAGMDRNEGSGLIRRFVAVSPANPFSRVGRKRIWLFRTAIGGWLLLASRVGHGPVRRWSIWRMYGNPSRLTRDTLHGYSAAMSIPGTLEYGLEVMSTWTEDMQLLRQQIMNLTEEPCLLIWGDRDRVVPLYSGQELHKVLRRSELVVIKEAGHLPYEELPEEFNRALLEYLD